MRLFKRFILCFAALAVASLCGCQTIRESTVQREWHQSEAYTRNLIYAQRPTLRMENLKLEKTHIHYGGGDHFRNASYIYSLFRFASDPDSRYRIIIVERRIPFAGSKPVVVLRDGFARDYWHRINQHHRERRRIIISPKRSEPNP